MLTRTKRSVFGTLLLAGLLLVAVTASQLPSGAVGSPLHNQSDPCNAAEYCFTKCNVPCAYCYSKCAVRKGHGGNHVCGNLHIFHGPSS